MCFCVLTEMEFLRHLLARTSFPKTQLYSEEQNLFVAPVRCQTKLRMKQIGSYPAWSQIWFPSAEACTSDLASEMSIDGYPASQELHMESRNLQLFNHENCLYFWCWHAAFPCKLTLLVESLTTFCHIQASYLTTTSDFFQAGCVTWGAISQKEHANKNWEIKI